MTTFAEARAAIGKMALKDSRSYWMRGVYECVVAKIASIRRGEQCCSGAQSAKLEQQFLIDWAAYIQGKRPMRERCTYCACKHLAQAQVLLLEMEKAYPEHYWLAVGHLAEAEDELVKEKPDLARLIRVERLKLEGDNNYKIDFVALIRAIDPQRIVGQKQPTKGA